MKTEPETPHADGRRWPIWVRWPPEKPVLSAATLGRFQIVALLPAINAPLAVLVGGLVLLGPLRTIVFTLATGALVGALTEAVRGGFESPAGQRALAALAAAGAVFVIQRVLGPIRGTLATMLADQLERHLEERVMRAVNRPRALRRSNYFRDLALTPPAAKEVRIYGLVEWLVDRFYSDWLRQMQDVWRDRHRADTQLLLVTLLLAAGAGADLLILDEPTANLDVRAEAELYDRFLEITKGLTTVLISHRFSTIRRAGRICVVEGGRLKGHLFRLATSADAGKSTIVKLLSRFYEPSAGEILQPRRVDAAPRPVRRAVFPPGPRLSLIAAVASPRIVLAIQAAPECSQSEEGSRCDSCSCTARRV